MLYHPDRHANKSKEEQEEAARKMQDVNEARGVLTDEKKRRKYDSGADDLDGPDMSDFFHGGGGGFHGGFPGFHSHGGGGGGGFNFHFG